MIKLKLISVACLLAMGGVPAQADGPKIYSYAGVDNYCPAGAQPITINGVICCGTPNQSISYQQAKGGWVVRTSTQSGAQQAKQPASAAASKDQAMVCPEGEKGCRYE